LASGVARSIAWQYAPTTEDEVKSFCTGKNGTQVSPADVNPSGTQDSETTIFAACNVTAAALCYDYNYLATEQTSAAKAACDAENGVFTAKATCAKSSVVGACTKSDGIASGTITLIVVWHYAPTFTSRQVMDSCASSGETFVSSSN
jgi:acyl dehydratase